MNDKVFWNFNTSPCVAVPGCRWQKLSHEEASDMFFSYTTVKKSDPDFTFHVFQGIIYVSPSERPVC